MRGLTFVVIRTFLQESVRNKEVVHQEGDKGGANRSALEADNRLSVCVRRAR